MTLTGTVEEVIKHQCRRQGKGIHLALEAGGESVEVHLGPAAFLEDQGFRFEEGDQIEVTGSRSMPCGTEGILARLVKSNGELLTLRDSEGVPAWEGRRHGRGWR